MVVVQVSQFLLAVNVGMTFVPGEDKDGVNYSFLGKIKKWLFKY